MNHRFNITKKQKSYPLPTQFSPLKKKYTILNKLKCISNILIDEFSKENVEDFLTEVSSNILYNNLTNSLFDCPNFNNKNNTETEVKSKDNKNVNPSLFSIIEMIHYFTFTYSEFEAIFNKMLKERIINLIKKKEPVYFYVILGIELQILNLSEFKFDGVEKILKMLSFEEAIKICEYVSLIVLDSNHFVFEEEKRIKNESNDSDDSSSDSDKLTKEEILKNTEDAILKIKESINGLKSIILNYLITNKSSFKENENLQIMLSNLNEKENKEFVNKSFVKVIEVEEDEFYFYTEPFNPNYSSVNGEISSNCTNNFNNMNDQTNGVKLQPSVNLQNGTDISNINILNEANISENINIEQNSANFFEQFKNKLQTFTKYDTKLIDFLASKNTEKEILYEILQLSQKTENIPFIVRFILNTKLVKKIIPMCEQRIKTNSPIERKKTIIGKKKSFAVVFNNKNTTIVNENNMSQINNKNIKDSKNDAVLNENNIKNTNNAVQPNLKKTIHAEKLVLDRKVFLIFLSELSKFKQYPKQKMIKLTNQLIRKKDLDFIILVENFGRFYLSDQDFNADMRKIFERMNVFRREMEVTERIEIDNLVGKIFKKEKEGMFDDFFGFFFVRERKSEILNFFNIENEVSFKTNNNDYNGANEKISADLLRKNVINDSFGDKCLNDACCNFKCDDNKPEEIKNNVNDKLKCVNSNSNNVDDNSARLKENSKCDEANALSIEKNETIHNNNKSNTKFNINEKANKNLLIILFLKPWIFSDLKFISELIKESNLEITKIIHESLILSILDRKLNYAMSYARLLSYLLENKSGFIQCILNLKIKRKEKIYVILAFLESVPDKKKYLGDVEVLMNATKSKEIKIYYGNYLIEYEVDNFDYEKEIENLRLLF